MAAFNAERHLSEAVDSVLEQTFADFEFLIVDDGSTDRTGHMLERIAAVDPRVRVIVGEQAGLTRSLNIALQRAAGRYVARMDADDVCEPDRFERQVHYLDEHPDVIALGTSYLIIDEDGEPIGRFHAPLEHEAIDQRNLNGGGGIAHPTAMIRRDALLHVGGYCEDFRYAQDLDLFLRLAEHGKLANLPEPGLRYRRTLDQISTRKRTAQAEAAREAIRRACLRRGLDPAPADRIGTDAAAAPADPGVASLGFAYTAMDGGFYRSAAKHAWAAYRANPLSPRRLRAWITASWLNLVRTDKGGDR